MNFDELDEMLRGISEDEMSESQKNSLEFTLTASAELVQKYGETAYAVPFQFIDMPLIAKQFSKEQHPALAELRESRFSEDDFTELQYGQTADQPSFAKVFADYMNMGYASVLHQLMEQMQEDGSVNLVFDGEKPVYSLVGDSGLEKDFAEMIVSYANIFL